ncbi:MAG TPA: SDR family NAD(P)-dependent oxidoreductase [Planctomycetota bacterium]|nr:SDR family NAD(P)-dependent oxidoreductase [Planctomycetota bacterium]
MARAIAGMSIVITGASAGIGLALARRLAAQGARLTLAARRLDRLDAFNAAHGGGHRCVRADVGIAADCAAVVDAARAAFGRIDTLVCNAGFGLHQPVAATSAADWRAMFATNLDGTVECIRAVLPLMRAQDPVAGWRGQIVIVSSCLARRAAPLMAAYSATKAAQLSLAEALRVEERPRRIAVTSVHPIGTETEFQAVAGRGDASGVATGPRQSADAVARAMLRAIRRPRPECWPAWWSRPAFAAMGFVPSLVDLAMARLLR